MIEGIIAGLISGAAASLGVIWAYAHGHFRMEHNELRRMKVALVEDVISYRYAVSGSHYATEIDAFHFNKTMARIPFIFARDDNVMQNYELYLNDVRNTDKLVALIRSISSSAGINTDISDTYARRTITIQTRSQPSDTIVES